MSKAKICASFVVLFLCLQPLCNSQSVTAQANLEKPELSADPIVDVHGNLLFFKTVESKSDGVQTQVTLISPSAQTATQTYPGRLLQLKRGEKAVYAIQRVPAASATTPPTPAAVSLVALVTSPGALPGALVPYALSGKFELFKIASGFLTGGPDVIYLGQRSSTGPEVLVLSFNGTSFTLVSGGPVPLD